MTRYLKYIIGLLIFLSCKQADNSSQKEEKFIPIPSLEPLENYLNSNYDELFFKEDHYTYINNQQGDSVKHYYTAEAIIIQDTSKYYLGTCNAELRNGNLLLKFEDSPLYSPHWLEIEQQNQAFIPEFYYGTFTFDSSWRNPIYKILYQNIHLDKLKYNIGDSLKGKMTLKASRYHDMFGEIHKDTFALYGLIKTIVK